MLAPPSLLGLDALGASPDETLEARRALASLELDGTDDAVDVPPGP